MNALDIGGALFAIGLGLGLLWRMIENECRLRIIEKTLANWPPPPPAALSEKDIRRMIVAERDRILRNDHR